MGEINSWFSFFRKMKREKWAFEELPRIPEVFDFTIAPKLISLVDLCSFYNRELEFKGHMRVKDRLTNGHCLQAESTLGGRREPIPGSCTLTSALAPRHARGIHHRTHTNNSAFLGGRRGIQAGFFRVVLAVLQLAL